MTKYLYTYTLFFLFFLTNCGSKKENDLKNTIVISSPKEIKPTLLGEYCSDSELIPLETSIECQIGRVDKLVVNEDNIFIADRHQKIIFVFNTKGEFCFKIKNIGKGPGEFTVLRDFWIDTDNKLIEVLCRKKIIRYDYQGKFIGEIKLSVSAISFAKTSHGNYYVWSGTSVVDRARGTVYYLNNNGQVVSEYFKWDGKGRLFTSQHMFTKTKDGILFRPFIQDYILREFDDNGIKNTYKVDFGKHSIPENNSVEEHKLSGSIKKDVVMQKKYAFGLSGQFETSNYIIFRYLFYENKITYKSFIFSKKHESSVYCSKLNNEAVLPHSLSLIAYADPTSDTFYSTYDAFSFLTFIEKRKNKLTYTREGQKVTSLLNKITPKSNPIIFKFKVNSKLFDNLK